MDYAVRAMCELAAHDGATPVKAEQLAAAQEIPLSFLENILVDLKRAELVRSLRGQVGGYRLGRPAEAISIADIIRAVEGPLADVRGTRPEALRFDGPATALRDVWLANRVSVRRVLEHVTDRRRGRRRPAGGRAHAARGQGRAGRPLTGERAGDGPPAVRR